MSRLAPLILLALLAGCASGPRIGREAMMVQSVLESAARQVQRCYRFPRVGHEARQIIVQLRIRVLPDGNLSGLPELLAQQGVGPRNRTDGQAMAAAAINAVIGCAPLSLPAGVYSRGPVEIDLTFAPLARV